MLALSSCLSHTSIDRGTGARAGEVQRRQLVHVIAEDEREQGNETGGNHRQPRPAEEESCRRAVCAAQCPGMSGQVRRDTPAH